MACFARMETAGIHMLECELPNTAIVFAPCGSPSSQMWLRSCFHALQRGPRYSRFWVANNTLGAVSLGMGSFACAALTASMTAALGVSPRSAGPTRLANDVSGCAVIATTTIMLTAAGQSIRPE